MKKLLLFIMILFFLCCDNEPKEKVYLPKMKFKRTENPNYSHYFPTNQDTLIDQSSRVTTSRAVHSAETIPSSNSEPISKSSSFEKNDPTSFFASLFMSSKKSNKKMEERICAELLDINKTVLSEQRSKLLDLKSDKMELVNEINIIERNYQKQKTQDKKENIRLENEIYRLNQLLKILSSEIK